MAAVLACTVGPGRVGKTARTVRELITYYLPYCDGTLYTNLPLKRQEIAKFIAPILASRLGTTEELGRAEALRRIQIIPSDVLKAWEWHGPGSGECPAAWFKNKLKPGDKIVLDEFHRYLPQEADSVDKELVHEWRTFVGELGHPGASLEVISQGQWKFSERLREEATTKHQLSHVNEEQDETTGIKIGDWWQFLGKLGGKDKHGRWPWYRGGWREDTWERRNNKFEVVPVDGQPYHVYRFDNRWFELYDSQAKNPGEEGGYEREKLPFERLTWFWFFSWFLQRNYKPVSKIVGYPTAIVLIGFIMWNWGSAALQGGLGLLNSSLGKSTASAAAGPAGQQAASLLSPGALSTPSPTAVANAVARETVERVQWDTAIVLMSERHVVFGSGSLIRVGEKVPYGIHAGKSVKRVDMARRIVQLDGGVVLQIGKQPVGSPGTPGQMGTAKPGPVAKGKGIGPEPDPKFSGNVSKGRVGSGKVSAPVARVKPAGAGGQGAGSRPESGGKSSESGMGRPSGAVSGQSGPAVQQQPNRAGSVAGAGGDGQTGNAVRAGSSPAAAEYEPIGKRQR